MSRLGGVALTSPSLHTERISEYNLNYPPFQILDSWIQMKLYTVVIHCLKMCMKEYGSCQKFGK
jgi:hypothetical protein